MPVWTTILTNNLKLAAVGTVAAVLAGTGAAATTMSLVADSTDTETAATAPAVQDAGDLVLPVADGTEAEDADGDAEDTDDVPSTPTSATPTVGIRPTDTHGYCVSTAVHAVTAPAAGGSLGAAKSAAAHSCAKVDKPAKADKPKKAHKAHTAKKAHTPKAHKPHATAKPAKAHGKGHGKGHGKK